MEEQPKKMTIKEHRQRHKELHKSLDELLADFIWHTTELPSKTSLLKLLDWSHKQTINPEEKEG